MITHVILKRRLYISSVMLFFILLFSSFSTLKSQEVPLPETFSTGRSSINSLDTNWYISDILRTSATPLRISSFNPPNSPTILWSPALITVPCSQRWVIPSDLPPPLNGSNWIVAHDTECSNETQKYTYRYFKNFFYLPPVCGGDSVTFENVFIITLDAYADNRILAVYINGIIINVPSLPSSRETFRQGNQTQIKLNGPWRAGRNSIEVLLENGAEEADEAGPHGLLIGASQVSDSDNDGVMDFRDRCLCESGVSPDGCPEPEPCLRPVASCKEDYTVILDDNGFAEIEAQDIDNGSQSECDVESITIDKSSFNCLDAGNYIQVTLTITDINGAFDQCETIVYVEGIKCAPVYIPNAFSPNNDGKNDRFTVLGDKSKVSHINYLKIINRWGDLVYSASNIPIGEEFYGWDGTFQGAPVNPAVFFYSAEVELIDGTKIFKPGSVTLVR